MSPASTVCGRDPYVEQETRHFCWWISARFGKNSWKKGCCSLDVRACDRAPEAAVVAVASTWSRSPPCLWSAPLSAVAAGELAARSSCSGRRADDLAKAAANPATAERSFAGNSRFGGSTNFF